MNAHPYTTLTPDCMYSTRSKPPGAAPDGRLLALNSYENRVYQVGMEEGPLIAGSRSAGATRPS